MLFGVKIVSLAWLLLAALGQAVCTRGFPNGRKHDAILVKLGCCFERGPAVLERIVILLTITIALLFGVAFLTWAVTR